MKRIAFVTLLLIPFIAYSQLYEDFSREVGEFNKIKASNGVKVNIIKGTPGVVKIKSRNVNPDDIIVSVNGRTLRLSIDAWSQLREKNNRWEVEIDVPLRSINSVTCVTGAKVNTAFTLSGTKMVVNSNTGGELYLDLDFDEVSVSASTGAILKLRGDTRYLEITSNMGSEVEADRLRADYVHARANMGGVMDVYARKEITSTASFGGEIEVWGSPPRVYTRKSLGGVIRGVR